jgi:hypothetical protein
MANRAMMDAEVSSSYLTQNTGTSWTDTLGKFVDTAATLGTAYLNRQSAVKEAEAARNLLAASGADPRLSPVATAPAPAAGPNWQKVAMIGGAVALGVAVLFLVARKS